MTEYLEYTSGSPIQQGVYACRIPADFDSSFNEDIFLTWFKGRWSYPYSAQYYRGEVTGWIGPLPRTRN